MDPSARSRLETPGATVEIVSLPAVAEEAGVDLARLPHTVKILLENLMRRRHGRDVSDDDVLALARWPSAPPSGARVAFVPARVLMQDFTGVPAVVDLAALRSAVARSGGDPDQVNPLVPADLIIDHSVQVDEFGFEGAYGLNIEWEYRRNRERYALLRWAQQGFAGFRVVPPGRGICHQVNLEYLGRVVCVRDGVAFPDTLLGTDSHTTMINALGILGWGVGGIEAEAAMLGQPMFLPWPRVVGVRLSGALPTGTTATDLVLTLTQLLRQRGVVGSFVEFFGPGLSSLRIEDRATLSNMCPEYGATAALFPADRRTLHYLRETGRGDLWGLVETYTKAQGLFRTDEDPDPTFSDVVSLDLATVEPSLAGPKRPQDRRPLPAVWASFTSAFGDRVGAGSPSTTELDNGSVVIASITSCTNTSNPSVMVAAGLLAKKAVELGLQVGPYVKTSLAPGSRVVTDYLQTAGLMEPLEKLGFYLVGFGCTTCIGNSGPLATPEIEAAVVKDNLSVVAVLSGNRNFEARIHPLVKASYLASPPLVVAFALAGTVNIDLTRDPIGTSKDGRPVMLSELWPSPEEVNEVVQRCVQQDMFKREYSRIFDGDEHWKQMTAPTGPIFQWDPASTYVKEPPYFEGFAPQPRRLADIEGARAICVVGDSVTTDHISPAGAIPQDSPAGKYLIERGVQRADFNSFGARRGNHEVMMRGTFGNIRLRNALVEREGYWTRHLPDGAELTIFEAAERYRAEGVPLVVFAGKEYGSGSSRDWAAKGPLLLGVRAAIAESFERIHRSNLVGMGILPLEFAHGETLASLGLTGRERFTIHGLDAIKPGQTFEVEAVADDGKTTSFKTRGRVDNDTEVEYMHHGGVLQLVLRELVAKA